MDYYNLDSKDIVILQTLAKDSRAKLSSMAEHLGISIPTVRSRIEKLTALGIIQDFTITISYDLLSDHPSYFITFKVKPIHLSTILKQLNNNKIFLEIHELIGEWHILTKTIPISMQELQSTLSAIRQLEGIIELNTYSLATTHQQKTAILPSQDIRVRLRCEYCGKIIEKDYQTLIINDVTHFLCCKSCLTAFQKTTQAIQDQTTE